MEPLKYLRIIRRNWRIIVGVTFLGFVAGFLTTPSSSKKVTPQQTDLFIATHTLMSSRADALFRLDQMAFFVTAGDVPSEVAGQIGTDSTTVTQQVFTKVNDQLGTLEISTFDRDPDRAVLLADSFASELTKYLEVVGQEYVDNQRVQLQARLDSLSAQIAALNNPPPGTDAAIIDAQRDSLTNEYNDVSAKIRDLDTQTVSSPVFTLQTATARPVSITELEALASGGKKAGQQSGNVDVAPSLAGLENLKPSKPPSPLLRGAMGGVAGLFISVLAALIFARLDPRIHTKEDAEDAFGVPVIAEIPRLTRAQQKGTDVMMFDDPTSRTAEAFRTLRSSILFLGFGAVDPFHRLITDAVDSSADGRPEKQVMLITSPGPAEGKTTTIANLATAFAELGLSVLVINCDFRKPRIHAYLGGNANERRVVESPISGVWILNHVINADETSSPATIIAAQRDVAKRAREMFDVILLDTAPLLTTNDASELLSEADVVLVVARAAKTTYESADRAMEVLERFDAPVVGVALTSANETPGGRYYYYYQTDDVPLLPGIEAKDDSNTSDALADAPKKSADVSDEVPGGGHGSNSNESVTADSNHGSNGDNSVDDESDMSAVLNGSATESERT